MNRSESASPWTKSFPLVGPAGEPVDLRRTFLSHGVASLPPVHLDTTSWVLQVTLPVPGGRPRTVEVARAASERAVLTVRGRPPGQRGAVHLLAQVRHMLRLDEDLSPFYTLATKDPALTWATAGAGRMAQSATVFEDVIKTICTTNCTWSATERMVTALVSHLGEKAPTAPESGWHGRTFPTPEAMASAGARFYRDVVRAGYRGPFLIAAARAVAKGAVNLEEFAHATLSDDEVATRLLALPGVGPYAAAHVMMLLGRYSRLILDSWTRPTYARLMGRRSIADATIQRRFRHYGPYAGLAFWLYLTKDWVGEASVPSSEDVAKSTNGRSRS